LSANVHPKTLEEIFFVGILLASRRPGTSTAGKMPTLFDDATKMPLTDTRIRGLKPNSRTKRYSDGYGLYVEVTPGGSKLWKLAYRFEGKQKTLSFGPYPEVSLARARERRLEARTMLFEGVDPSAIKKAGQELRRAEIEDTFARIADELLKKEEIEGLAPATLKKKRWLARLASEDLGPRPIRDIKAPEILATLRRVEKEGNYESARRLRALIGQIFRYAIATTRADGDPTVALKGALIAPKAQHRAAVTDRRGFAKLIRTVWTYEGTIEAQAALKLLALLYPRPGELRLSHWSEFDFEEQIWTIPADRTKTRRLHRKPLPGPAIEILKDLKRFSGKGSLVLPSQMSDGRPLSENTMNYALRRLDIQPDVHTCHGFRASASSLLNESGKWHPDAIEAELAHVGDNHVRQAYHRATYWDERVRMAEWWAAEVIKFSRG
jgi:integrase